MMNDYEIARYSKNDIREFWSTLLNMKKEELVAAGSPANDPASPSGEALHMLKQIMSQLEKQFDLF